LPGKRAYTGWIAGRGYQISGQTDTTLTYTRTFIPAWAIVVAIIVFPIGLIALLVRREAVITVAFSGDGTRSTASLVGTAQRPFAKTLDLLDNRPLSAPPSAFAV
jgi:hypothetical protein